MKKKKTPDFESQMQRLQEIVEELEQTGLPLDRNVELYKEGRLLARSCKKLLDDAHNEILLCDREGLKEFGPASLDIESAD